jgi:isoleucyl-tRNA synthetase
VTTLLAPYCPFLADELHRNLTRSNESVHLADWPEPHPGAVDDQLESEMGVARQIVTLGRAARAEAKVKIRQPLSRALLRVPSSLSPEVVAEIADELNVKDVELVDDLSGLLEYAVVPNFRRLGPRLGDAMPAVKAALAASDGGAVRDAFATTGVFRVRAGDHEFELTAEDVEIRAAAHEHLTLAQSGDLAVALDTELDDDLRLEGIARELVHALNGHRKELGLQLSDRVRVTLHAAGPVAEAARRHGAVIAEEVLAVGWEVVPPGNDDAAFVPLELDSHAAAVRLDVA